MSLEVNDRTAAVLAALGSALSESLDEMGQRAETHAKEYVPVKTGNLRDSIHHWMETSSSVVVGTDVHYAPIVELGLAGQRAQPYLRPALNNHVQEYRDVLVSHVKSMASDGKG